MQAKLGVVEKIVRLHIEAWHGEAQVALSQQAFGLLLRHVDGVALQRTHQPALRAIVLERAEEHVHPFIVAVGAAIQDDDRSLVVGDQSEVVGGFSEVDG